MRLGAKHQPVAYAEVQHADNRDGGHVGDDRCEVKDAGKQARDDDVAEDGYGAIRENEAQELMPSIARAFAMRPRPSAMPDEVVDDCGADGDRRRDQIRQPGESDERRQRAELDDHAQHADEIEPEKRARHNCSLAGGLGGRGSAFASARVFDTTDRTNVALRPTIAMTPPTSNSRYRCPAIVAVG